MTQRRFFLVADLPRNGNALINFGFELARDKEAHLVVGVPSANDHSCWKEPFSELSRAEPAAGSCAMSQVGGAISDAATAAIRRGANSPIDWQPLPYGASADEIVRHARHADLIIVGQRSTDIPEDNWSVEEIVAATCRPVLIVPPSPQPVRPGRRVILVWDSCRGAAHTLLLALEWLRRAEAVRIFVMGGDTRTMASGPGANIGRYLARHGVDVDVETEAVFGRADAVAARIIARARSFAADMIVIGAYRSLEPWSAAFRNISKTLANRASVPVFTATEVDQSPRRSQGAEDAYNLLDTRSLSAQRGTLPIR